MSIAVTFGNLVGSLFFAAIIVKCMRLPNTRLIRISTASKQTAALFLRSLTIPMSNHLPCKRSSFFHCLIPVVFTSISAPKLSIPSGTKYFFEELAVTGWYQLLFGYVVVHSPRYNVIHLDIFQQAAGAKETFSKVCGLS